MHDVLYWLAYKIISAIRFRQSCAAKNTRPARARKKTNRLRNQQSRRCERENSIAVELDNRPTLTSIPGLAMKLKSSKNIWYDWWHYGGIVRDVWLSESEGIIIRRQQILPDAA